MSFIPNKQEYRPILIKGRDHNVSRNVLIHKEYLEHWQALESTQHTNFYRGNTYRFIYRIGGIADQRDHNKHTINNSEVELSYCFDELGDVYIQSLSFVDKQLPLSQKVNVHPVVFEWTEKLQRDDWVTRAESVQSIDLSHELEGTHRVAVGGSQFKTKENAGNMLATHIINAYSLNPLKANREGNYYSLVWLNDEFKSSVGVNLILDAIFSAATQDAYLDWVVHGKACVTFKKAMQELPKHAHLKARNENLQDAFKKQRVFFSNPRGEVTEAELKRLCEASGLSYHGTRIDPHDWWSRDARKDMINGHGVAVSKLALGGSFMAYAGLPYVEKFLDSASTSVAGAATLVGTGIGAYVVLKSTATKNIDYIKHMPKIWNSSMGKGHLSWD